VSSKRLLQSITPSFLWNIGKDLKRRFFRSVDHYAYAPDGWSTRLRDGTTPEGYWTAHLGRSRAECEALIAHVRDGTDNDAVMTRIAFGDALKLMARDDRRAISILDYGGGLGEDYWAGRALMPELIFDYHCKELPDLAAAGRTLSPDVHWHTDDACLEDHYDVVMFSSSLQYLPDWKEMIRRAAGAARRHLFISNMPMVRVVPTYVATGRSASVTNLHWLLNRDELVKAVDDAGFSVVQETAMGEYPDVADAPEQPSCAAILFERRSA
jgi:putative methyltransferase (TIGR04325 family)